MFALHMTVERSLAEEEEQEEKENEEKKLRGEIGGGEEGVEGSKSPGSKKTPALGRDQTAHVAK